ncbi:MAG: hypothetical protein B7733_11835 [Myxococcales bacterium FL481]|nr:MAG: hypothetical protein B7733_11835 [Myxococcales bacterium FL481]
MLARSGWNVGYVQWGSTWGSPLAGAGVLSGPDEVAGVGGTPVWGNFSGGCGRNTPEHVAAIAKALKGKARRRLPVRRSA